jgi:hypothetical protein
MSKNTRPRVHALCCECGNLRTVAASYRWRYDDPESSYDDDQDPRGWRLTRTLRCSACEAMTRHAILREDDARDEAELREYEHRAVEQRVAENADTPSFRIADCRRSAGEVRVGRHPGTSRYLAVIDASGNQIATAFEYSDSWQIDAEYHLIKMAGLGPLDNQVVGGFRVRSEAEAYDWLRLFGALTTRKPSQQSSDGNVQ